jgi:hypothetical protein
MPGCRSSAWSPIRLAADDLAAVEHLGRVGRHDRVHDEGRVLPALHHADLQEPGDDGREGVDVGVGPRPDGPLAGLEQVGPDVPLDPAEPLGLRVEQVLEQVVAQEPAAQVHEGEAGRLQPRAGGRAVGLEDVAEPLAAELVGVPVPLPVGQAHQVADLPREHGRVRLAVGLEQVADVVLAEHGVASVGLYRSRRPPGRRRVTR